MEVHMPIVWTGVYQIGYNKKQVRPRCYRSLTQP
jgi:hypothetical protein